MARADVLVLAGLGQAFERELAHGLEQVKARDPVLLAAGEEALVGQRRQAVQRVDAGVRGDLGGRLLGEAAREHAEPSEERLLVGAQEVVAPGERGAQRLLASGQVAPLAREQGQRLIEARQHRLRRQDARPRGGQLDGQGEAIQAAADLRDRGVILGVDAEVRTHLLGALLEQGHAGGQRAVAGGIERERRHRLLVLALHPQRLARRDEDLEARARRGDAADGGRGVEHLLEVVEHEQRALAAQVGDEQLLGLAAVRGQGDLERRLNGREHVLRRADAGELDVVDVALEGGALRVPDMDREAGLSGAPRPRQRDDADLRAPQQLRDGRRRAARGQSARRARAGARTGAGCRPPPARPAPPARARTRLRPRRARRPRPPPWRSAR